MDKETQATSMENNYGGKLSDQELYEARGGIDKGKYAKPQYDIGAKLCKRDDPACFGSVIDRYGNNGQWIYRIMGSDTRPEDIAENELSPFRFNR